MSMQAKRNVTLGSSVLLISLVAFTSAACHAQATPLDTAKMFLTAFNAGDNAKAVSLTSSNGIVIVDEFAPHLWSGKSAFAQWSADYEKDAKSKNLTDPRVTMSAPLVNTIEGDVAYLVCPMTYSYKLAGKPMREPARMAMVLHKESAGWRFASWTWAGTAPQAAAK